MYFALIMYLLSKAFRVLWVKLKILDMAHKNLLIYYLTLASTDNSPFLVLYASTLLNLFQFSAYILHHYPTSAPHSSPAPSYPCLIYSPPYNFLSDRLCSSFRTLIKKSLSLGSLCHCYCSDRTQPGHCHKCFFAHLFTTVFPAYSQSLLKNILLNVKRNKGNRFQADARCQLCWHFQEVK